MAYKIHVSVRRRARCTEDEEGEMRCGTQMSKWRHRCMRHLSYFLLKASSTYQLRPISAIRKLCSQSPITVAYRAP